MQEQNGTTRSNPSQILPLVIAAFAGATLAIACERPDSVSVRERPAVNEASVQPPPGSRQAAPRETSVAQPSNAPLPPPELPTDTVITSRIKTAMLADPEMAGADVSVNTDEGVVTLVGKVKSYEQMGIASAHAQRQDGVMRVDNELYPDSR